MLFQPVELKHVQQDSRFPAVEQRYQQAFAHRRDAAEQYLQAKQSGDPARAQASVGSDIRMRSRNLNDAHAAGEQLVGKDFDDTNYIFLSFVTRYLAGGRGGTDRRGDFFGGHVVHLGRDQFSRRRDCDRHLPAAHQARRVRPALSDGLAHRYRLLGLLRHGRSRSTAGISER